MKIQPIDFTSPEESSNRYLEPAKPVIKSRFKRLFERQFSSVLKISAPEKPTATGAGGGESHFEKDICDEFEPSSVCLNKMVENFIYESNDKQLRCGRNRCNCLRGNCTDSSDDESDSFNCFGESNHTSSPDTCETLKVIDSISVYTYHIGTSWIYYLNFGCVFFVIGQSLVPCACISERNLLADIAKIVEKYKISKRKDDFCRKVVTEGLLALGYDASICKSRWEKSSSFPAGKTLL